MIATFFASLGFVIATTSFIGGFRMIRRTDHAIEASMHKFNGFLTIFLYLAIASISLLEEFTYLILFLWCTGFGVHLLKLVFVKKGLAVRYGGYMGGVFLIIWLIIIFNNLP
ncbi:MAG: hypothetical protein KAT46_00365 [Deltaproteobacteria bacterium]|nr:hypothetical protein [Deltaproteobacteria bacterium]